MVDKASAGGASDKRQFLVHIEADLIRRIKILAIERGTTASSLVQQAMMDFLVRQGTATTNADHDGADQC